LAALISKADDQQSGNAAEFGNGDNGRAAGGLMDRGRMTDSGMSRRSSVGR